MNPVLTILVPEALAEVCLDARLPTRSTIPELHPPQF